jgi:hypothetical protein
VAEVIFWFQKTYFHHETKEGLTTKFLDMAYVTDSEEKQIAAQCLSHFYELFDRIEKEHRFERPAKARNDGCCYCM